MITNSTPKTIAQVLPNSRGASTVASTSDRGVVTQNTVADRFETSSPKPTRWDDWDSVGEKFRGFEKLSSKQQNAILRGDTVCVPVSITDRLLWGSVFRYVPDVKPEELSKIFEDYDGQSRFVPGMTETRTLAKEGDLALVYHRINPITFVDDESQELLPAWIYAALTYSYKLDEELRKFNTPKGKGYSIRWAIPQEKSEPRARENGEIRFTPMKSGTLITYNNATEPFGYDLLSSVLPASVFNSCYNSLGELAQDYYCRTVDNLVVLRNQLADRAAGKANSVVPKTWPKRVFLLAKKVLQSKPVAIALLATLAYRRYWLQFPFSR